MGDAPSVADEHIESANVARSATARLPAAAAPEGRLAKAALPGLLTVLDVGPLAVYCQAYCRWREAEEVLAVMRDRDQATRGLMVKSSDGNPRRNPLVKIRG
jgi:phage terminase small subunit